MKFVLIKCALKRNVKEGVGWGKEVLGKRHSRKPTLPDPVTMIPTLCWAVIKVMSIHSFVMASTLYPQLR